MAKQLNIDLNVRANTDQAKRAMMELQQSLTKVAGSFASSGGKGMDTQLKAAAQAAQQLSHHLSVAYNADTGKINLNKFSASLKSANTDLKTLSSSLLATGANGQQAFVQLAQNIAAAERPVISLNSKLTSLWTVLKNTARWQISSTILHGFMSTIQQAYGYAQDLNKSLTNIGIVTGYNTDRMAAFAVEANKAAKSLSTTTNEYAKGSLIYFQQGLKDADVRARTDATVKMANVTGQSMEQTSNQLTAIWNNFAKGSTELELFADKITALGAETASSSAEISEGLNQFAAVANTVGLSYDYATAALATVVATTRQSANVVGTAFKTLFARIEGLKLGETLEDGTDLNKYSEALMAVGVNIKETNGEMKDMDRILDEIGAKWDTLAKDQQIALAQAVAGVRQYTQFIALMDHWDFMQENLETAANATGTLQKQQERYAESWEAANKRLRASTEAIFTDLIDDKFFIKLTDGFAQVVDGIHDFIEGIGGAKTLFIGLGSIILSTVAQKIEPALRSMIVNIRTMFQTPQQQAAQQQAMMNSIMQTAQQATGIDPKTFNLAEQKALENAQQLSMVKSRLMVVSKDLTDVEKAQYEQQIMLVEKAGERANKIYETITALQEENNELQKNIDISNRSKVLWEEEVNSINSLKEAIRQERVEISQANLTKNEAQERTQILSEKEKELAQQQQQLASWQKASNEILQTLAKEYTNLVQSGKNLEQSTISIKNVFTQFLPSAEKVDAAFNNIGKANNKTGLQDLKRLFTDTFNNISKVLETVPPEVKKAYDALMQLSTKDVRKQNIEEYRNAIKNLIQTITEVKIPANQVKDIFASFKASPEWNKLDANTQKLVETMLKGKEALQGFQQGINGINPEHAIKPLEAITRLASSMGQLSMVIMSIKSLFSTLANPDATGWEKFGTVLMSVSMIVPSVIGTISNLGKALKGLGLGPIVEAFQGLRVSQEGLAISTLSVAEAQEISNIYAMQGWNISAKEIQMDLLESQLSAKVAAGKMTEAQAEAYRQFVEKQGFAPSKIQLGLQQLYIALEKIKTSTTKQGVAQRIAAYIQEKIVVESLGQTILKFLPLVAAIAAVTALIVGAVKLIQYIKENSPEGKAKSLAKGLEEAKEAADEADQKFKELQETIKGYDESVKGIALMTKGTKEFTEAVENANEKARNLIDTYKLTSDQFYRDSNGIIQFNNGVLEQIEREEASNVKEARAAYYSQQNAVARNDSVLAQREQVTNLSWNNGLSSGQAMAVIQAANEKGWDNFFNSAEAKENIIKALYPNGAGVGISSQDMDRIAQKVIDAESALRENSDRIAANTDAITTNNKMVTEDALYADSRFTNLSPEEQKAISTMVGQMYSDLEQQNYEAFSAKSTKELMDLYAKEFGLDTKGAKVKSNNVTFEDGTEIDRYSMASMLSGRMSAQAITGSVGGADSFLKQSLSVLDSTKRLLGSAYNDEGAARIINAFNNDKADLTWQDVNNLSDQMIDSLNQQFGSNETKDSLKKAFGDAAKEGLDDPNISEKIKNQILKARMDAINSGVGLGDISSIDQYGINRNEQNRLNATADQYSNTGAEQIAYNQAIRDLEDALNGTIELSEEQARANLEVAKTALEAANAMGKHAAELDIDADIYEAAIKANDKYVEGQEEAIEAAEREVAVNIKRTRALDNIAKESKKVSAALDVMAKSGVAGLINADKDTQEGYTIMKQNLADILGIEQDLINMDKLAENPELLKEALDGGAEAAETLRDEMIKTQAEAMGLSADLQSALLDPTSDLNAFSDEIDAYIQRALAEGQAFQDIVDDLFKIGIKLDEAQTLATYTDAQNYARSMGMSVMEAVHAGIIQKGPIEMEGKGASKPETQELISNYTGVEFFGTPGNTVWMPQGIIGGVLTGGDTSPIPIPIPGIAARETKALPVKSEAEMPNWGYVIGAKGHTPSPSLGSYSGSALGNKGSKGGKGGGGGSGGKTQTRSATITKPTVRRYSVVQNTVDSINKQLDVLGKNKDRVWGKSQIDIMDQEIDRLGKLKEGYEDFAKEISGTNWDKLYAKMRNGEGLTREDIENAGGYLSQDFQALFTGTKYQWKEKFENSDEQIKDKALGNIEDVLGPLMIGANGAIANTDALKDANDVRLAKAQAAFDASAQTDADKNELERAKAEHAMWEQVIDQYQETANKNQDNFQEWLESIYAKQDKIIEQIDTKLKNGIDISERTLKRLEYTGKILGDSVYKSAELMKTWWSNGQGKDSWTEAQREWGYTQEAYSSLQSRLASGEFANNFSGYLNELRELQSQGYNIIDQLLELDEKNRTYYSEVIEKANEEMAKLTDEIAHNSSVLEHMQNVLSLLGRSMDYEAIGTLLKGQRDIAKSQMDVSTAQYQSAKAAFDRVEAEYKANVAGWSEDQIRYFEESMLEPARRRLNEAYDRMYEDTEAFLEKVRAVFDNTLNQIMKESEDAFTNGLGWDYVNDSMALANSIQDEYLTKTNQIYETNDLMRKLARDIDKTESAAAKAKLKNFSDEIAAMQQQEKLTQTDLEIAKARYELLQAEMALEDAKNAKSIVRLQRDNEGNYGYVYTADQGAIDEAEDNWANKQNDLYNLVLGKTNEYNQKIIQATKERDDALRALSEEYADKDIEHNEEYQQKKQQILDYYSQIIYADQESLNSALFWLGETAATDTNEAWSQSFSDIVDKCLDYEDIVMTTNENLDNNMQQLNDSREEISSEVKTDLDDIKKKTDDLTTSSDEYAKKIQNELLPKLNQEIEQVEASTLAYINKRQAVIDLMNAIMDLNSVIDNNLDEQAGLYTGDLSKLYAEAIVAGRYEEAESILAQRDDTNTNIKNDMLRKGGAKAKNGGIAGQQALKGFSQVAQGSYYQDLDYLLKKALGMATGGYTGEWSGNDGKLALLHQKELVLNAEDTKNILSSVSMIRQIADMIDLRAAAQNLTSGLLAPLFQSSASNEMNQNVTITAEFPNVTNRGEIDAAFDNLINRASQFAGRWGN